MTLLIGTLSNNNVVITADGLSLVNSITGAGIGSDTFRKIFPIPGIPIVFAHHGLNVLDDKLVSQYIECFVSKCSSTLAAADVETIAQNLRLYGEAAAQKALADPTNLGVVGFWIAGFSPERKRPEFYEICWPYKPEPCKLDGVILGGDAQNFIAGFLSQPLGSFKPKAVRGYSTNLVTMYHQALYSQAEQKQAKLGGTMFGGRRHQVVIEKTGWRWSITPEPL